MKLIATLLITIVALMSPAFAAEDPVFVAPFNNSIGVPDPLASTKILGYHYMPIQGEGTLQLTTGAFCIWPNSTAYTFRAAAGTVEVSSTDADDQLATSDTGARTVLVVGLDASYNVITETLTCFGLAAAVDGNEITGNHSTKAFLRVLYAKVLTAGTSKANEGIIYIHSDHDGVTSGVPGAAGEIYAMIPIGEGISNATQFSVPAGYSAIIEDVGAFNPANMTASIQLLGYDYGESWRLMGKGIGTAYGKIELPGQFVVAEKADVVLKGQVPSDAAAKLVGNMKVRLVKNY